MTTNVSKFSNNVPERRPFATKFHPQKLTPIDWRSRMICSDVWSISVRCPAIWRRLISPSQDLAMCTDRRPFPGRQARRFSITWRKPSISCRAPRQRTKSYWKPNRSWSSVPGMVRAGFCCALHGISPYVSIRFGSRMCRHVALCFERVPQILL